jgi:hypothetical protein
VIDGSSKVTDEIRKILGIDRAQFRSIAMIAQGEFRQVLDSSTDERIKLFRKLFDTEPYDRLAKELGNIGKDVKEKYEAWTAYKIEQADGDVYFMWCPNSDHGNYLFFASDSELYVEEQEFTKLAAPIGKISVRIKTKDASQ